jgi:hypothetical protein
MADELKQDLIDWLKKLEYHAAEHTTELRRLTDALRGPRAIHQYVNLTTSPNQFQMPWARAGYVDNTTSDTAITITIGLVHYVVPSGQGAWVVLEPGENWASSSPVLMMVTSDIREAAV